ncbi:hypothetical protein [Flavobacterium sp. '19STA2R22 D10 B1']|uniref:hypothetical protein n=1 Tax=Flavobacterium aerium TaxID=3037261 RepID=UPI00278C5F12|nr:hypothetical protein [Flavobacterium sp. '19STA2R22 D10 B1']
MYVLLNENGDYYSMELFGVLLTTRDIQHATKYNDIKIAFRDQSRLLEKYKCVYSINTYIL